MWARLVVAVLVPASIASAVTLVENGRSRYSISLPPDPIPAERRAASELQRFIEEMSGARLPIVGKEAAPGGPRILLGAQASLGAEAFVLKTSGPNLLITGGRPRGVLYGVYTLLDKLGCRWYTRDVSRIPSLRTVRLPHLDETQRPAFEYREPYFSEALERDWAVRNRTNGHFQQLDESVGGKVSYHPFVHSFYNILPPDNFFKDHPEYFSFIDGKRRWERAQLCLTNPDVLRLTVGRVREWVRDHPEATIFSVSQNDWEGWCECDNCRRVEQEEGGEHSGPMLRFVNSVAAEIEKTNPDKLIDTIAYWYTENPPAKVRPRPNVRIRLCPIGVCESHAYEKCPRSTYFVRNLRAWSNITSQLYIWHYNTNFSHYLLPFPDFDELAADIPLYKRNGVVGIFLEGAYPKNGGGENAELRSWVMARQLWDPSTNVDAAVNEFLGAVYGKAAKAMRAYYDLMHAETRAGLHIWIFTVPEFSAGFLPAARKIFDEAERAAESDAVRARVRKARLSIEYLELLHARAYRIEGDSYTPAALPALKERLTAFLARLRQLGFLSIHEGRDLAVDEKDADGLRPFRTATLENDNWRAVVVPELSGRVVSFYDKRASKDLLRRLASGERGYPEVGGLSVTVHADYQARPFPLRWEVEPGATPTQLRLTGTGADGLRIRQQLALGAAGLTTESVIEGGLAGAVLQARVDFDPDDIDRAAVTFRRRDGASLSRPFIRPGEQPAANEVWSGPALPDGAWAVGDAVNRFPVADVERAAANWTAKGPFRATLSLWSKAGRLSSSYGRR